MSKDSESDKQLGMMRWVPVARLVVATIALLLQVVIELVGL